VTGPTDPRPLLPAACTLAASDGADQVARWQALRRGWQTGRTRDADELRLTYRAGDDSRAQLAALVAVEQRCCAFLDWRVEERPGELLLRVRGSADALDTIDVLESDRG
jgi:hypothetical protein